jgi:aminoglycoside phosphotransferase (APT) family kinase protein
MTETALAPPELAPVRAGEELDWPRLEAYLRAQLPELDGGFSVQQFPNGAANLTYQVRFGDTRLVVRRPPFGLLAPRSHDMQREHRVLSALHTVYDRAPRSPLFCDDHSVIGADFLVVEYRPGVVVWGAVPPEMAHHDDLGRRVGLAVVDALADLHLVDPTDPAIASLGRPEGFVERQLVGWTKRWALVAPAESGDLMNAVSERLAATMPASTRTSVLHLDPKLDNCQFDPADPDRVRSVFDWDMATVGDPLVDLGMLLGYWPDPSDTDDEHALIVPGQESLGLPTRAEVVARYADRCDADLEALPWYEAFACWSTAVVLEQLHHRYLRGETKDERMATRGDLVPALARRAAAILERWENHA